MILIGLGSNLSFCGAPPQQVVPLAIRAVGAFARVDAVSSLYASPAWPNADDPEFVNAAAILSTGLSPAALLAALHLVEASFGRRRGVRNAPRTLDIDLLAFGRLVSPGDAGDGPALPHPRLAERDFVLVPIVEIATGWTSPASGLTAAEMLARLPRRTARPLG